MRVSVIIPAYKHDAYILDAIRSVQTQSSSELAEVIVVNDGSPDATAQILEPLIRDGSILYIEQENAGQSAARNRGAAAASGELLAFLDDDDTWPEGKLASQVEAMSHALDCVMVWGEAADLASGKQLHDNSHQGRDWQGPNVIHQCLIRSPGQTLIRRDAFVRVGGLDPSLWGTDDFDLYIRLAAEGRFIYEPEVALHYRWHPGNASNQGERMRANEQKLRRKHADNVLQRVLTTSPGIAISDDLRFKDHLWLGWFYFLDERYDEARRHYLAAAKLSPGEFFRSGAWKQARSAFLPRELRTLWRQWKQPKEGAKVVGKLASVARSR